MLFLAQGVATVHYQFYALAASTHLLIFMRQSHGISLFTVQSSIIIGMNSADVNVYFNLLYLVPIR